MYLKATGIVRRIDDLGRVVIPKEIRRTMRIREGDPLEIFTDKEGEVILKKYSPIGELGDFASQYAETLAKTSGHIICITDKDAVVAVSGAPKREFIDKRISGDLERVIEQKTNFISKAGDKGDFTVIEGAGDKYTTGIVTPIISEGDAIGTVVFLSKESGIDMGEVENKLAESAAGFLGKQMEQ